MLRHSVLSVAVLGLVACQGSSSEPDATASARRKRPETLTVEARRVPKTQSYVGMVVAPRDAVVSSMRGGRVEQYAFDVGQSVTSGTVLVKLGAAELNYASQAAEASAASAAARVGRLRDAASLPGAIAAKTAYELAADNARRTEKLHQQGSASEQELLRVRANEASAKAQYDAALADAQDQFGRLRELQASSAQAQAALGDKSIRAPFDGIVLDRFIEVGQMAAPNAPLLRVIDPSELRVRFDVPQFDADKVALGNKVIVAANGGSVPAVVVRSTPGLVGESNARLVEARLELGERGDGGAPVLPGARLPLWLEIGGDEEVVDIPVAATTSTAGLLRAWVVKDGRLVERLLNVGRFEGDRVLVRAGLQAGDELVKAPQVDFRLGEELEP